MYPDIVVAASSRKPPFCAGLEMRAVDGLQVVEMVDEGLCAHDCGAGRRGALRRPGGRCPHSIQRCRIHTHARESNTHTRLLSLKSAARDSGQ